MTEQLPFDIIMKIKKMRYRDSHMSSRTAALVKARPTENDWIEEGPPARRWRGIKRASNFTVARRAILQHWHHLDIIANTGRGLYYSVLNNNEFDNALARVHQMTLKERIQIIMACSEYFNHIPKT